MTNEQRNLILQAIGALKAALGNNTPELPFDQKASVEIAELKGFKQKTRDVYRGLYKTHGMRPIKWNTSDMRRIAYENNMRIDNIIKQAERVNIVSVERAYTLTGRARIISFRFIKAIK